MKNIIYAGAVFLLFLAACGPRDNKVARNFNAKTLVDDKSLEFIKSADEANIAEVKVSTIAEAKSKNQRVINFAKMMITDHSEAGKELKDLAAKKYVTLADSPSVEHTSFADSLAKITDPAQFDKAFMRGMVADHEKVVTMFNIETETNNESMKEFAKKYLPALKMHLDSAKAIYSSLK